MNAATIGAVDKAYTSNSGGIQSIENQIQLLQQQIALVEQSTLDDSEKESRVTLLEARIANLQLRLEIVQSRESASGSASENISAIESSFENTNAGVDAANVLYQPQGSTTYANSGTSRLIAYA